MMIRDTLLDVFDDLARTRGTFLVEDDGLRVRAWTYGEVAGAARAFAGRLRLAGITPGDKIVIWGENRPEWIAAFWGCVLHGAVVVPIDFRASREFLARVCAIVQAAVVVTGDEVDLSTGTVGDSVLVWRLRDIDKHASGPGVHAAAATKDTIVEILFTSGATADPKGVVITHRNILANIVPVEIEVRKYLRYARPVSPIRFLNLLPLSHMFGQVMATFVPPMLSGEVVFMRRLHPKDIVAQIRRRRISVLVSVPKILNVLRAHVDARFPAAREPIAPATHWLKRWWLYRDVHRAFGWKFWAAVVGAAPLDPADEEYWQRLGFLVIQGYGLTEAAPIVTLNHPFATRRGSVGTPIAGVEVKIAADGEILVHGENVMTGYYGAPEATAEALADGWLHTGDIGALDEEGRLYIRGRKKEMIVTPEGLKVFPEDVERTLRAVSGVRDAAVVGRHWSGEERVHAVLVLSPATTVDAVLREANQALGDHQKIRSASVWPDHELPRTEGTRKLKRREVKQWVEGGTRTGAHASRESIVSALLAHFGQGREDVSPDTSLDQLGLSSLERVELLMALEERARTTIDEGRYAAASTVGDLLALLEDHPASAQAAPTEIEPPLAGDVPDGPVRYPSWNRHFPATLIRRISLPTWILPACRLFAWIKVEGIDHLRDLEGPVVFAANHQSHMDTPAILWALPARWRYRVAVTMAKEFFKAHFFPLQYGWRARLASGLAYYSAALFFNAFPLPQREAGTRQTLRYIGMLLDEGLSVLIFPEGKRTAAGEINTFRPGIGMIGSRLDVPIVPIGLTGLDRVLHQSWKMAKPGPVRVRFGRPLRLTGENYAVLAGQVESAVRDLV